MDSLLQFLFVLASFGIVALAARQIGSFFGQVGLPLISGFLFTGILVGPFILDLVPHGIAEQLRVIDEVALAFIAFAAGSELYLKELRGRLTSIAWVTVGLVTITLTTGILAMLALADYIPFMQDMPFMSRVAVAILAGAILVARSPSAAIAIINELRAKGPFTQTVLGVTIIMDVVVIIIFALNVSIANALLENLSLDLGFLGLLALELLLSALVGFILSQLLVWIISRSWHSLIKVALILLAGYSVFFLSGELREISHTMLPFEVLIEPLLICLIGSFIMANTSQYRTEMIKLLHDSSIPIYVAFFALTGASLELDVLANTWPIALALFSARLVAIAIGSFTGGFLAGEPMAHNRVRWMGFVTQAGVGLGLSKEVAVEFPTWGASFATLLISVIVINEIIGPLFFKAAIKRVGEAHSRAPTHEFDGVRDALIFGLEDQALTLAQQLQTHGWEVRIASRRGDAIEQDQLYSDIEIVHIPDFSLPSLQQVEMGKCEAIVTLLSDEENYEICEAAYEQFGINTMVVRLNDRENFERFHELGALIVEPSTAIVGLLEQFVRSPSAASLLMGMEEGQDIIEVEVVNPMLYGIALRDLRLPLDIIILSIQHNGHMVISHGYTRLEQGDRVTLVGSVESLDEVVNRFDG